MQQQQQKICIQPPKNREREEEKEALNEICQLFSFKYLFWSWFKIKREREKKIINIISYHINLHFLQKISKMEWLKCENESLERERESVSKKDNVSSMTIYKFFSLSLSLYFSIN